MANYRYAHSSIKATAPANPSPIPASPSRRGAALVVCCAGSLVVADAARSVAVVPAALPDEDAPPAGAPPGEMFSVAALAAAVYASRVFPVAGL